jgi:hypothetical protein
MAAFLPEKLKTDFLEGSGCFPAGNYRQAGHF